MRRISILGATGSIGQNTLDLIRRARDEYHVIALTGAGNIAQLAADALEFTLALANKESLVTAGPLLLATARARGARILPVDSEHSAVFQALVGEDIAEANRVIITASGGAFRDWALADLARATVAEASSHPNWDMGQRITIDSASMFNKALEVIETKEFFGFSPEQIEVLVHPQSLVHALVGFRDGALMAHVGPPDMRHAIGYALHWPRRRDLPVERLDLAQIGTLEFRTPDAARYPALDMARQVMDAGGLAGAVFNAAKERALDHFISGHVDFVQMSQHVARALDVMGPQMADGCDITLESVARADHLTRQQLDRQVAA